MTSNVRSKVFGDYVLELPEIGKGGMAYVYRAHDRELDRYVAIKIMYTHLADEARTAKMFVREAKTAARLNHPNIVHILRFGEHEGTPFIAMELVEGRDLSKWLEQHGPLPRAVALIVIRDLLRALEHAHGMDRPIMHRDIKPSNLMLGKDGTVRLMDFGLAREEIVDGQSRLTQSGLVIGTVRYMSPEQASGESVGVASDVFSAGVLAYELLAGRPPFEGRTATEVMRAILSDDPPPLDSVTSDVPRALSDIMQRMLQKDPEHRPKVGVALEVFEQAVRALDVREQAFLRDYVRAQQASPKAGAPAARQSDGEESGTEPLPASGPPNHGPPLPIRDIQRPLIALAAVTLLVVGGTALLRSRAWLASPVDHAAETSAETTAPKMTNDNSLPAPSDTLANPRTLRPSGSPSTAPPSRRNAAPASRVTTPGLDPAQETPVTGRLRVVATPSARVIIDGVSRGTTSAAGFEIELPVSKHSVVLEGPGSATMRWNDVQVSATDIRTLEMDFTTPGTVLVTTRDGAWAHIYVDGVSAKVDAPNRLTLAPGLHRISLVREGCAASEGTQSITVLPAARVEVRFTLDCGDN